MGSIYDKINAHFLYDVMPDFRRYDNDILIHLRAVGGIDDKRCK